MGEKQIQNDEDFLDEVDADYDDDGLFDDVEGEGRCESCGAKVLLFEACYCNTCAALVCRGCVLEGDDVCGDECPCCGRRFD